LQFVNFVSHLSSSVFRTILLIFQVTQFIAILHAGSLVSCCNFQSFLVCFSNRSRPDISYFQSKIVIFLVDSLYARAIEAAQSCAALSALLEE
jgi:hypothetical protein